MIALANPASQQLSVARQGLLIELERLRACTRTCEHRVHGVQQKSVNDASTCFPVRRNRMQIMVPQASAKHHTASVAECQVSPEHPDTLERSDQNQLSGAGSCPQNSALQVSPAGSRPNARTPRTGASSTLLIHSMLAIGQARELTGSAMPVSAAKLHECRTILQSGGPPIYGICCHVVRSTNRE